MRAKGRIFLRWMIDLASKTKQLDHWIHLNTEFRADLLWWDAFLTLWNGRSILEVHNPNWQPQVTFSSDTSGTWGCGAIWDSKWLQIQWESHWLDHDIVVKELIPIIV